jgi:hypothetical protein
MNTVKRVIAIISTILVAFPLSAVSAQAANGCDGTIPQVRGWTQINEPKFDHVVDQVRAAAGFDGGGIWMTTGAVDPVDPNKIYVTEGRQLLRSTDGGCSWKKIYELPMSPTPTDPHSAAGGDTIVRS